MKTRINWTGVFEVLDPPPGGLDRLRSRVDADGGRRERPAAIRRLGWAAAATASPVALLLATMAPWSTRDLPIREALAADANPALVRLGVAEEPFDAISIPPGQRHRIALEQVKLSKPGVIYYRVVTLGSQPASVLEGGTSSEL